MRCPTSPGTCWNASMTFSAFLPLDLGGEWVHARRELCRGLGYLPHRPACHNCPLLLFNGKHPANNPICPSTNTHISSGHATYWLPSSVKHPPTSSICYRRGDWGRWVETYSTLTIWFCIFGLKWTALQNLPNFLESALILTSVAYKYKILLRRACWELS